MKVFISLPMHGKTETAVKEDLQKYLKSLELDMHEKNQLKEDEHLELIDTVTHSDTPAIPSRLWYLGEAIKKLDEADLVYFAEGWEKAKGCWVEFAAACAYGKPITWDYPDLGTDRLFRLVEGAIMSCIVKEDANNGKLK